MPNCINYNCDEITEHLKNDCEEFLQGGVSQVLLLECNHAITDPSNATQVNAAISDGTATLIQNVKLGIDAASPETVDSPIACRPPKLVNYTRTASWLDGNVNAQNVTFYNTAFNGRSFGGMIVYECSSGKVTWYDDAITLTGNRIIPNTDAEFQRFEGVATWKGINDGSIHDAPAGVFD